MQQSPVTEPCKVLVQALRSALYGAAGPEQLPESISAGLNWMDGEPKEGPDLVPSLQVRLRHASPATTMLTLSGRCQSWGCSVPVHHVCAPLTQAARCLWQEVPPSRGAALHHDGRLQGRQHDRRLPCRLTALQCPWRPTPLRSRQRALPGPASHTSSPCCPPSRTQRCSSHSTLCAEMATPQGLLR